LLVDKVDMKFAKKAEVYFQYDNVDVSQSLNNDELDLLKGIFDGKMLFHENFSCGFSETISIKFNGAQTFCIARDTCPIVYWKEKNKYIRLSEDEKLRLYHLLEQYGFFFPCV